MAKYAFISYVREDEKEVLRVCDILRQNGIEYWIDKEQLNPGDLWEMAVESAIRDGGLFLAFFSENSTQKDKSFMRQEIILAIDIAKQLPLGTKWIIPIKVSECSIPRYSLGSNLSLDRIHYIETFRNFDENMTKLLNCLGHTISYENNQRDHERELNERLIKSQRMDLFAQMAGSIAHDFGNLFTAINGFSKLIEGKTTDDNIKRYAQSIGRTGQSAYGLVKNLLTFSRGDLRKSVIFNIVEIVKEVKEIIRTTVPTTIELKTEFPEEPHYVLGDPDKIRQCILNLCLNSRDAIDNNEGEITIKVKMNIGKNEYSPDKENISIQIEDTGSGISPDLSEKIFDPFFTTKNKGSGLGLSVVYGIIKQHQGEIHFKSQLGEGSIFTITLPLFVDERSDSENVLPTIKQKPNKNLQEYYYFEQLKKDVTSARQLHDLYEKFGDKFTD
jgi:signal transduction histidine kinase